MLYCGSAGGPQSAPLIVAKWEVPTPEEVKIIHSLGLIPEHCAVSHPGENQLVIVNWRDHRIDKRETYVRLPEKRENPK